MVSLAGFLLVQASRAAGIDQLPAAAMAVSDTLVQKDSAQTGAGTYSDPKKGFKNLFAMAMGGQGMEGARLNPMAVSFVEQYIARNRKGFTQMKEWGKPYLDMMDEVLRQHGLPGELKYIAVIESGLKYNAISWAGAVGPWAFMPSAARQYGLRMTRGNDERLDYHKSTHAAARLLTDLYARYGDWLLVIAAYNGGPGNVDKAIRKAGGSKDFWTLQYYLPNESMNHVKKFIGTHYIFEGEGGITTVTKEEMKDLVYEASGRLKEEELSTTTAYNITGRFHSSVILRHLELDKSTFDRYNPGFDKRIALDGKYELRLPTLQMNRFVEKRYEILEESIRFILQSSGTGQ